jgi:hypothetical protein
MRFKEQKIFLSSTFRDLHAERDYLLTQVFPKLDFMLRRIGIRLHVIDLRGSEQESRDEEYERKVFDMCLDEVDNCKPRMVGIIGANYGWVPFESGKSDEAMTTAASGIAARHGLSLNDISGKSITHLEIVYGLRVMDSSKCFFFFRQLDCQSTTTKEQAKLYINTDERTEALKRELLREYGTSAIAPENEKGHHLQYYHAVLADGYVSGLENFGELVLNNLSYSLHQEFTTDTFKRKPPEWYIRQINYWDEKALGTVPRPLPDGIIENVQQQLVYVSGKSGTGKSVLMAQLYSLLQESGSLVLPFVAGLEPDTQNFDGITRYLLKTLCYVSQMRVSKREDFFDALNRLSASNDIVILFDGLDMLEKSLQFWEENFVRRLPNNVRVICAVSDKSFSRHPTTVWLQAPSVVMPYIEAIAFKHGKKFNTDTLALLEKAVHEADNNLNYAELLIRYLLTMRKEDYEKYKGETAHLQWMQEVIETTPRTIEGCIAMFIRRASDIDGNYDLIIGILKLLKTSPVSLSREDLLNWIKERRLIKFPPPPRHVFDSMGRGIYKEFEKSVNDKLLGIYNLLRPLLIFDATSVYWTLKPNIRQNINFI